MRHLFIAIYEKLTSWFCVIIIPCFMFSSFFYKYYYLKHTIVIVVMLWGAIIAIGGMMSYLFPYIKTPKQPLKEKGMIGTLYLNSEIIIPQIYCWYFVIYITFSLEFKSILYNYLMLLLTGLFLGYKTTMKVNKYTLEEAYRKKQEHKKQKRNK